MSSLSVDLAVFQPADVGWDMFQVSFCSQNFPSVLKNTWFVTYCCSVLAQVSIHIHSSTAASHTNNKKTKLFRTQIKFSAKTILLRMRRSVQWCAADQFNDVRRSDQWSVQWSVQWCAHAQSFGAHSNDLSRASTDCCHLIGWAALSWRRRETVLKSKIPQQILPLFCPSLLCCWHVMLTRYLLLRIPIRRWWIRNLWEKIVHSCCQPCQSLDWNRVGQTATMTCAAMSPFHMGTTELVAVPGSSSPFS